MLVSGSVILCIIPFPRDPITFWSDDEQGVYNHLRKARYLGSMKPFSEGEPGSLGILVTLSNVEHRQRKPPVNLYLLK